MNRDLLLELSRVFSAEASALAGDYAWPPKRLTKRETAEVTRLGKVARDIERRALKATKGAS